MSNSELKPVEAVDVIDPIAEADCEEGHGKRKVTIRARLSLCHKLL